MTSIVFWTIFAGTKSIELDSDGQEGERRGWGKGLATWLGRWIWAGLGLGGVVAGLAALAAFPVLNVLTLGYFLESSGRVAKGGRLRDGFPGVRRAAVLAGILVVGWLCYLPMRIVSGFWKDARLVEEGGRSEVVLSGILTMLCAASLTLLLVLLFLGRGRKIDVVGYLAGLRLPYLFWLGLRGLAGGVIWLALPVGMMWAGTQIPGEEGKLARALLALTGGGLLSFVGMILPFLQTRFAASGKMQAFWQVGAAVERIHRAPLACWLGLTITLVLALPLYLGKIEPPPQELGWLPAMFFIVLMWPGRLALGWAWSRTGTRSERASRAWIWLGRLGALAVAVSYALFVWLMQFLASTGAEGILEQHAFLLPTPFWEWE